MKSLVSVKQYSAQANYSLTLMPMPFEPRSQCLPEPRKCLVRIIGLERCQRLNVGVLSCSDVQDQDLDSEDFAFMLNSGHVFWIWVLF